MNPDIRLSGKRPGKEATALAAMTLAFMRSAYNAVEHMSLERQQAIYSGNFAVYTGMLTWTLGTPDGERITSTMPVLMSLRIEDGLVVEQKDYADYRPFIAAYRDAFRTQ